MILHAGVASRLLAASGPGSVPARLAEHATTSRETPLQTRGCLAATRSSLLARARKKLPRRPGSNSAAAFITCQSCSAGDVLMVTRLDRLARSTRDLLNILDAIGKAGGAFKSLGDSWADTTTPHGRLMVTVLGGLAEFERELILARTGDSRARAKAKGVKFGRPLSLTLHQRQEAIQRLAAGEAQADIARTYNVSQSTISRLHPLPFEYCAVVAAS
jgi:DNA invertase Pin-like site-specific DNA recombinase